MQQPRAAADLRAAPPRPLRQRTEALGASRRTRGACANGSQRSSSRASGRTRRPPTVQARGTRRRRARCASSRRSGSAPASARLLRGGTCPAGACAARDRRSPRTGRSRGRRATGPRRCARRRCRCRGGHLSHRGRSAWPPNCVRIADRSRSAKSASPRELKRSKSAAASTLAGTPSRPPRAPSSVPRPSPTRCPLNSSRPGDSASARGGQVEQPRGHHAAAPPHLGDLGDVDVVPVVAAGRAAARSRRRRRRRPACRRSRDAGR